MNFSNQFEVMSGPLFSRFPSHYHSRMAVAERVSTTVRHGVSEPSMNGDGWEFVKV
jgi:hypothetical protein